MNPYNFEEIIGENNCRFLSDDDKHPLGKIKQEELYDEESLLDLGLRLVCGIDDERKQVIDTTKFPYNCICQLIIEKNSKKFVGTGFKISPNFILTNAHNITFKNRRRRAKRIRVTPAWNGRNNFPFGFYNSNRFYVPKGWIKTGKRKMDYALIKIRSPKLDEKVPNNIKLSVLDNSEKLEICGYPKDKYSNSKKFTMWKSLGKAEEIENGLILYNIDTYDGQSGSPIMYNSSKTAIAIHAYGKCPNAGVLFTGEILRKIYNLIKNN